MPKLYQSLRQALSIDSMPPRADCMPIKLRYLEHNPTATDDRYFVRIPGRRRMRLYGLPGSIEWLDQYKAAVAGKLIAHRVERTARRKSALAGSLRHAVEIYYQCDDFKLLGTRTQRLRRNLLDRLCTRTNMIGEPYAQQPFRALDAAKIIQWRDEGAVETGNSIVKVLRQVFKAAIPHKICVGNPAKDVGYRSIGSEGYRPWTSDDIRQFEATHPIGSKARLALALLIFTGQRRGDVVGLGKQHIRKADQVAPELRELHPGRWLAFTQQKNHRRKPVSLWLPIIPELETVLAKSPCGDMTFLINAFGRGFTEAGFGNWFRKQCDAARLDGLSAHGCRKAGAVLAAERGATEKQLMAVFGWRSGKQAAHYTRSADQKRLAAGAMHLLGARQAENETATGKTASAEAVAKMAGK